MNEHKQLTKEPITLPNGEPRVLRIETYKRISGPGIQTQATVVEDTGDGGFSYVLFQDYSKQVQLVNARATAKAIAQAHASAVGRLDEIKAQAIAHYAKGLDQ